MLYIKKKKIRINRNSTTTKVFTQRNLNYLTSKIPRLQFEICVAGFPVKTLLLLRNQTEWLNDMEIAM